jgi:hypothetical protein
MNKLTRIAVALSTVAACSFAFADTGSDADQARRQQNVDEVLARHHVNLDGTSTDTQSMSSTAEHPTLRERTHRVAEKTRDKTHQAADSTRNFTHRQLTKARDFSARQDARFPAKDGHAPVKAQENPQS